MSTRLASLVLAAAALAAGASPALADTPASGRVAIGEMTITKNTDQASPVLMQAAATTGGFRGRYQLSLDQAQNLLSSR